jgi:hypothetical protein
VRVIIGLKEYVSDIQPNASTSVLITHSMTSSIQRVSLEIYCVYMLLIVQLGAEIVDSIMVHTLQVQLSSTFDLPIGLGCFKKAGGAL